MLEISVTAGNNEEVTGVLLTTLTIETWKILQQLLPPQRFLAFDYNRNKQISATVGSVHDPSAVCSHPHLMQACHV